MENIFLKILNMSITASYLVVAVVLLRLLLKKAPKSVSVAMWILVGLRLVLPFSFESAFSLIPSTQTLPPDIALSPTPMIQSGIPALNDALNPMIFQSFAPNPGASANPLQILLPIAAIIWIVGMAVMGIYALVSWLQIRHTVRERMPLKENIYLCDRIPTPFILGLFRPRIYLPSATAAEDIPYVLAHEKAHLRRKDHLWKPLGFAILAVHWFNPLVWVAYVLLCRDIESACDEKVLKTLGLDSKKPYSQALISCSVPRRSIAACPLAFGEENVKGRIKAILNYKKPAFWVILIAIILCVGLAIGFLTDPKEETPADITIAEPTDMACVEEMPVLMGDTEEFSLVFGGNYNLHHTLTVSQLHPVWCLTVNNIGPDTVKVEILGTVYPVAPATTAYIYATEDWQPGDYPVSFTSTQPMEGNVRCSLHMSHGFSSADTVIGGADGPTSILADGLLLTEPFLPSDYLEPSSNSLDVYIWQMAENSYSCALVSGGSQEFDIMELAKLEPMTIPQVRQFLVFYNIPKENIVLRPIRMPHSSYYYEIDENYQKSLEALFWEPILIHSGKDDGVTMEIRSTGDLAYDLTVTYDPETATIQRTPPEATMICGPLCEFYAFYDGNWYPLDEYLRDICGRTDIREQHRGSTVVYNWTTGCSYTEEIDLKSVYGSLPAGQYRVQRSVGLTFKNQDPIVFLCTADFTVEE